MVTPAGKHCGEFETGLAGLAGPVLTNPFTATLSIVQVVFLSFAPETYILNVTLLINENIVNLYID